MQPQQRVALPQVGIVLAEVRQCQALRAVAGQGGESLAVGEAEDTLAVHQNLTRRQGHHLLHFGRRKAIGRCPPAGRGLRMGREAEQGEEEEVVVHSLELSV